jgi:hypothetical protein
MRKHSFRLAMALATMLLLIFSMMACAQTGGGTTGPATTHGTTPVHTVATTAAPATTSVAGEVVVRNDSFDDGVLPGFWHVVAYVTLEDAGNQVVLQEGALSLTDNVIDRAPILVSDPIPLSPGQILTVSRKVRLHYANDYFSGAMRITGLADGQLNLTPGTGSWDANLGKILANIDYLHYFYMEDNKAATDGFVLYNVADGGFSASQIATPVFDSWFEETLVYWADDGKISWTVNGQEYTAQGLPLQQPAVSVVMHGYGWYTGHQVDLDQITIKITPEI